MNENENNFESLRRLLALKRLETPPPGYFENFSTAVMARIRAGGGAAEQQASELPWLFRLLAVFEAKPAFAGGFAFALCLFLLLGIVYAERPVDAPPTLLSAAQDSSPLAMAAPVGLSSPPAAQPGFISSTNPIFNAPSTPSWFVGDQTAVAHLASFTVPGN